jgi:uncharacterized protein YkwD
MPEVTVPSAPAQPASSSASLEQGQAESQTSQAPQAEPTQQTQNPGSQGDSYPTASGQTSTGAASYQQQIIDLHNKVRAQYGASPLVWNQTLADLSAGWSKQCQWKHTSDDEVKSKGGYGQNYAANYPPPSDMEPNFSGWAGEADVYNWANPSFEGTDGRTATGHFTQIVWKDTTSVGCGWTTCGAGTIQPGWAETLYFVWWVFLKCECFC